MKKCLLNRCSIFISIFLSVLISSCKKETIGSPEQSRPEEIFHVADQPFKMVSGTSFRLSPRPFKPLDGQPVRYESANLVGAGNGSATYMGDIKNVFNQLLINYADNILPSYTINAPALDVLIYPVVAGDPLPRIQPNDFDDFRLANASLNIPKSVNGCIVNSVIYNDRGDAIFTSLTANSKIKSISPTRESISIKGKFVGGRGRFANATGTYTETLVINSEDFNDAKYTIEGTISF